MRTVDPANMGDRPGGWGAPRRLHYNGP